MSSRYQDSIDFLSVSEREGSSRSGEMLFESKFAECKAAERCYDYVDYFRLAAESGPCLSLAGEIFYGGVTSPG